MNAIFLRGRERFGCFHFFGLVIYHMVWGEKIVFFKYYRKNSACFSAVLIGEDNTNHLVVICPDTPVSLRASADHESDSFAL